MLRNTLPVLLTALCPVLAACPQPEPTCGLAPVYADATGTLLSLDSCTGALALGSEEQPEGLFPAVPAGRPGIAWARDEVDVTMNQGRFTFEGWFNPWKGLASGSQTAIGLWEGGTEDVPASLAVGPGPRGSIHLRLDVLADVDRVSLALGCPEGRRFYGLGARPDGTDHTGKTRMLYTSEQGIGQEDYRLDEFDFLRGRTGDTYFPVPWTVTDAGTGFAIGGFPVARMYLCGEDEPGVLRFETWGSTLDLYVFAAGSPRQAVGDWTLASGPPAPAPDWAYGPWIALQRGTGELLATAEQVRAAGIPASALWAQDWVGGRDSLGGYDLYYHWTWDEEAYPGLPDAIDDLHGAGLAFLGYFNPFVTEGFQEWDEAEAGGYLPRRTDGTDYTFSIVDRPGSMVDLDDSEARAWAKSYLEAATAMGQDGWMCDYAEWLPFDSVVGDGLSGQDRHNAYPIAWQTLNMEVLDEAWGAGNALCFNRSGWAGTQAIAPVTWGGDQETTFARDDGMPSAREIGVGLGLSGIGRYGSDVAGYTSIWADPTSKELYFRWVEMSAFEPVFRTHDGLSEAENWHWASDDETLAHFARYAKLHMRLLPYLRVLDREYMGQGLPMMRHAILVESGEGAAWETLRDAPDQHFLGDDLLVAPVMQDGAVARTVVVPPGRWYGLLDGSLHDVDGEPRQEEVQAELSEIPVFARAGLVLPLLDGDVVTAYPEDSPDVVGTGDRRDRLDLQVFSGAGGGVEIDGRAWTLVSALDSTPGQAALDGQPLDPLCEQESSTLCLESDDPQAGTATWRVDWGQGARTLAGEGWSLSVDDGGGLAGRVTLRYPPQ